MNTPAISETIRDIKPPINLPENLFLWLAVGIFLLLIGSFFLFKWIVKKLRERKKPKIVLKPPHEVALEALEYLRSLDLPIKGKVKEHYFELSSIVRRYIENRFAIRAPEMTYEEFLISLKDSSELSKHKDLLQELLGLSDFVKFAKYGPSASEVDKSFQMAKSIVIETTKKEEEKVIQ